MSALVISSQEDAWEVLRKLAVNQLKVEDLDIQFSDFPKIHIKYEGSKFNGTIPVRVMKGLGEIQKEIYRLYALAIYEDESKLLSREEKDALELYFRIDEGSLAVDVEDLIKALSAFVKGASKKMNGQQIVVIALIGAIGLVSCELGTKYIQSSATSAHDAAEVVRSQEETKRMEIIRSLVSSQASVKKAVDIVDETMFHLIKPLKEEEKVQLPNSVEIDQPSAKELLKTSRRKPEPVRLDGNYFISNLSRPSDITIRVTIRTADGKEYVAEVTSASLDVASTLASGWAEKKMIKLEINARQFDNEYRDIEIVTARPIVDRTANMPE